MSAEQELHELEAQLRSASGVPPREQLRQFLRLVRPWGRQGSRCMRSWQPQARPGDAAGRPRRPTLPRRPRRSVAHVRAAPARRLLRSAARRASTMQSSSRAMAPCCCSTTAVGCRRRSVSGSTGHTAPAAHAQTASPARSLLLLHASTQRCTCAAYLTSPNPSNSTVFNPHPFAVWLVHEQVAVAGLECGALPLAAQLIKAAMERFPEDSVRVKRLQVRGQPPATSLPSATSPWHLCAVHAVQLCAALRSIALILDTTHSLRLLSAPANGGGGGSPLLVAELGPHCNHTPRACTMRRKASWTRQRSFTTTL